MARAPFDYELSIAGQETAADRAAYEAELPKAPRSATKSEAKRVRDIAARAGQGDRTDWRLHLKVHLPTGYRLTPDTDLSHAAKMARTASLKAAAKRRTKRRNSGGAPLARRSQYRSASRNGDPEPTFDEWRWERRSRLDGWWSE